MILKIRVSRQVAQVGTSALTVGRAYDIIEYFTDTIRPAMRDGAFLTGRLIPMRSKKTAC